MGCSFVEFNQTEWPRTATGWYLRAYAGEIGVAYRGVGSRHEVLAAFLVRLGELVMANQGEVNEAGSRERELEVSND